MRARRAAATARGSASAVAMLTGYLLQTKNDPPRIGHALASVGVIVQRLRARVNSSSTRSPFRNRHSLSAAEKRRGKVEQPVERRAGAGSDDIHRMRRDRLNAARANRHIGLGDARRLAQEGALCANRPRSARRRARPRIASTSPGRPAPLPRSITLRAASGTNGRSCAESRICRRHRSSRVSRPTRLMRADHRISRSAYASSRASVSRETGTISAKPCGPSGQPLTPPVRVATSAFSSTAHQCRRRHPGDASGGAERRRPRERRACRRISRDRLPTAA